MERILVMGVAGSGKTYQWLLMARQMPNRRFYCIDTDDAIPFMLTNQFRDLQNVIVLPSVSWDEYRKSLDIILKSATSEDWVVVDMADNAWNAVQRYYVTEVFKENIGDYFLEVRKSLLQSKKQPTSIISEVFKGWVDWTVINKLYEDWVLPLIYQSRANFYATTKVTEISHDDDQLTRSVFGTWGIKPAGQKHLAHQVHSIFLFYPPSPQSQTWRIQTIKDRSGRPYFENTLLVNFYLQYYVANQPARTNGEKTAIS